MNVPADRKVCIKSVAAEQDAVRACHRFTQPESKGDGSAVSGIVVWLSAEKGEVKS